MKAGIINKSPSWPYLLMKERMSYCGMDEHLKRTLKFYDLILLLKLTTYYY